MKILARAIQKARVYMVRAFIVTSLLVPNIAAQTRSRTKAARDADVAAQHCVDPSTGLAVVAVVPDSDHMLQRAIEDEHTRDVEEIGDEEPGADFTYPVPRIRTVSIDTTADLPQPKLSRSKRRRAIAKAAAIAAATVAAEAIALAQKAAAAGMAQGAKRFPKGPRTLPSLLTSSRVLIVAFSLSRIAQDALR